MVTGVTPATTNCGSALRLSTKSTTDHQNDAKKVSRGANLTSMTMRGATTPEMVRDERMIQNSGELLQKESV
jgi:hypothetical protein